MCLVIDTCALSAVFDGSNLNHKEFCQVKDWIINGNGKIVFGGTKYILELSKTRYLKLFSELRTAGKVVTIEKVKVDNIEINLNLKITHRDFDDAHILAIVIASCCKIVCTKDERAMKYIKMKRLYPSGMQVPKIYSKRRNKNLLSNRYITSICK